jgi:hypothetical protein
VNSTDGAAEVMRTEGVDYHERCRRTLGRRVARSAGEVRVVPERLRLTRINRRARAQWRERLRGASRVVESVEC